MNSDTFVCRRRRLWTIYLCKFYTNFVLVLMNSCSKFELLAWKLTHTAMICLQQHKWCVTQNQAILLWNLNNGRITIKLNEFEESNPNSVEGSTKFDLESPHKSYYDTHTKPKTNKQTKEREKERMTIERQYLQRKMKISHEEAYQFIDNPINSQRTCLTFKPNKSNRNGKKSWTLWIRSGNCWFTLAICIDFYASIYFVESKGKSTRSSKVFGGTIII